MRLVTKEELFDLVADGEFVLLVTGGKLGQLSWSDIQAKIEQWDCTGYMWSETLGLEEDIADTGWAIVSVTYAGAIGVYCGTDETITQRLCEVGFKIMNNHKSWEDWRKYIDHQ